MPALPPHLLPRLSRPFYQRDPVTLARDLLGKNLVRILPDDTPLTGRIIEVEAYLGVPDRAAHTFNGHRSPRNNSMYLDAGHAYVYFTYGMHFCLNVVSDTTDIPTACLIRALQPLTGIDRMRQRRADKIPLHRLTDAQLCSGPAKLCQALAIARDLDGEDLTTSPHLYLTDASPIPASRIAATPRIGIPNAAEWTEKPLRFLYTP